MFFDSMNNNRDNLNMAILTDDQPGGLLLDSDGYILCNPLNIHHLGCGWLDIDLGIKDQFDFDQC